MLDWPNLLAREIGPRSPEEARAHPTGGRRESDPNLLLPVADRNWSEAIAEMRAGLAGVLNVCRVTAHNLPLLRAWATLRQHGVIDRVFCEQKELVILRIGHRWRSHYEWAHHVVRGQKVGLIARAAIAVSRLGDDDEDSVRLEATDTFLISGDDLIWSDALPHLSRMKQKGSTASRRGVEPQ